MQLGFENVVMWASHMGPLLAFWSTYFAIYWSPSLDYTPGLVSLYRSTDFDGARQIYVEACDSP